MNKVSDSKPSTEVSDFAGVLLPMDGAQPSVIVGGHAVNLWSMYFLSKGVAGLADFLPFTSKDLDLLGTVDLLDRLHYEMLVGEYVGRSLEYCRVSTCPKGHQTLGFRF